MQDEIFKTALGAVIRHFLTLIAGVLGTYGVNEAMQGELVAASIPIIVSIVFGAGSLLWSYLQKKYQIGAKLEAHQADPNTPMSVINNEAAIKAGGTTF